MKHFKPSWLAVAIGATIAGQAHGQAAGSATLDMAVVIDESGSMSGEHAFIGSYVSNLDQLLQEQNVTLNQYGLVGFGGSASADSATNEAGRETGAALYRHFLLGNTPADVWGDASEFDAATAELNTSGGTEDGYRAIDYTYRNFTFRGSAGSSIMLISDEDRDNDTTSLETGHLPQGMTELDKAYIQDQLAQNNTVVHAVVDQVFTDLKGREAVAVVGADPKTGHAYVRDDQGRIIKVQGYKIATGYGTTQGDYSELALASGGTVMDIDALRSVYDDADALNALTGELASLVAEITQGTAPVIGVDCSNASGKVASICAALANSSSEELQEVAGETKTAEEYRQLTQYQVNQMLQTAMQNSRAVMSTLRNRLALLRQAGANVADINLMDYYDGNIALNSDTTAKMRELRGGAASGDLGGVGYFLRGKYTHGDQDTTAEANGFDSSTYSLVAGVDRYLNDKTQLGASLNYATSDADFDQSSGGTDSDTYGLTLYGSRTLMPDTYLEASLGYSWVDFDTERDTGFGTAHGNTDGEATFASLGLLRDYNLNRRLMVQPFAYLNYIHVEIDGFEESGTATALRIGDNRLESLTSELGASAAYQMTESLTGTLSLAWEHEFKNSGSSVATAFVNSPNNVFNVETPDSDNDYGRLGVGLSKGLGLNRTLSMNGEALFGHSDYAEYGVELQFRQEF
ncbi:autotransporter outer membrane beta-barrel domain-containing protein [Halomonas urmiana]|uniref:Autotransporter outer membrane beta-barrel domain-containing protein n=1 Tax=Halomonas urmiana TaxID=490901 RepID=A0A5R8MLI7_9GAMM|nr:autotransporter outer membrane beta-barrel domain-containing protein [Halomonas urmiana]TLF53086.1 autotransporter outer membrane beta-barrel domain-containing protein [Halomonas urmiana]